MKSSQNYLDEANAVVQRISSDEAVAKHMQGAGVFIDVRDSAAIKESGTVKGAFCIPRGFIEFAGDDATPYHNPALQKNADIYLVCGAGGQAALAGKTLMDMGFKHVKNIGGFSDWKDAGGPVQSA